MSVRGADRTPWTSSLAAMSVASLLAAQLAASPLHAADTPARGVVKALHQATLSTDLVTPVMSIGFREGQRFVAGDVLLELDCRRLAHEADALAAAVREAKVAVDANVHLAKSGASNRNEVDASSARYDKATAEWNAARQRLAGCRIEAPFAGIVTELQINAHETPTPNRPLLTIVSDRDLEIELLAPSRLAGSLEPGTRFTFAVDESGRSYTARLVRTGGAVDPMSQTFKLYGTFDDTAVGVLPGMSGTAHFDVPGE